MAKAKYKCNAAGYYETKVWDGTYVNGVKHRIKIRSNKSSRDLERKVIEHNEKIFSGSFVKKSYISFLEYARQWKTIYKGHLAVATRNMYENIIEKHLYIITCNISDVGRIHYMSVMTLDKGDRTKQQISLTFKQIVKAAIKDKYLPASAYSDIFDDTIKVKYKAAEKRPLTENEKNAIAKADITGPDLIFLYIIYGCGLRRGEALALTRFDINPNRKELSIHNAIAFDKNTPLLKDTKNGVHRVVPIPESIFPTIWEYIMSLNCNNLFHMANNTYITKSSFDKMWARIVRKLNAAAEEPIEGLTPHIFRHNYCTNLCYKIPEISIGKIAELLGDSEKMVIEVYNHVIREREKPAEIITELFDIKIS